MSRSKTWYPPGPPSRAECGSKSRTPTGNLVISSWGMYGGVLHRKSNVSPSGSGAGRAAQGVREQDLRVQAGELRPLLGEEAGGPVEQAADRPVLLRAHGPTPHPQSLAAARRAERFSEPRLNGCNPGYLPFSSSRCFLS